MQKKLTKPVSTTLKIICRSQFLDALRQRDSHHMRKRKHQE